MRKLSIWIILSLGAAIVLYNAIYPTYTYRYRLTISVEVDGQTRTGSSVIEVRWIGQPNIPDAGSSVPRVRGQAAFVDLGPRGALVATLVNGESYGPAADGAVNALWLVPRAFKTGLSGDDFQRLPTLSGRKDLATDNFPRLLWFPTTEDWKTARVVKPQNISTVIGTNARIVAAYVEITRDPIVLNIDDHLTWLRQWDDRLGTGVPIEYGFALKKAMFIGS